jgi:hypothetical protein
MFVPGEAEFRRQFSVPPTRVEASDVTRRTQCQRCPTHLQGIYPTFCRQWRVVCSRGKEYSALNLLDAHLSALMLVAVDNAEHFH